MGNSEGGHSRTPSDTRTATDSLRRPSKTPKGKLHLNTSQVGSPAQPKLSTPTGTTLFYDDYDADKYHTCKSEHVAGSHDLPMYYFTASNLRNVGKKKSKSQDADLNRVSSDLQKTDVREIAWPQSDRKSDTDADAGNFDTAYVTASTELTAHFVNPTVNTVSADNLRNRVEKFNNNKHGLHMSLDVDGILVEGSIRVHMHLVSPITTRMPLTLHDMVSCTDTKHDDVSDVTFFLPADTTKLITVTSKDRTTDVICRLMNKFSITDNPSRFVLCEKDTESNKLRHLRDEETPLLLCLTWSEENEDGLSRKQFVLKEIHADVIKWDAFSVPELNNFLKILDEEEKKHISLIQQNCSELRACMTERMKRLSSANTNFSHYGVGILY